MGKNLVRNINIAFRVTEEERTRIAERMKECGIKSVRGFLLKMALNGYIFNVDMSDIRELTRLLRSVSNNVNQIARHANTTGGAYAADMNDIKERLGEIWGQLNEVVMSLSKI